MTSEIFAADRDLFVFRCHVATRGNRWTFCVDRSTLQALEPESSGNPALIFDHFRHGIYKAAYSRMVFADPTDQQVISAQDVRNAG